MEIERAHVTRISADVTNGNHDGIGVLIHTDVLWYVNVTEDVCESVSLEYNTVP